MKTENKTSFAWITSRAAEIAPLLAGHDVRGREFANMLLEQLIAEHGVLFPEVVQMAVTRREKRHAAAVERMKIEGPKIWALLHKRAKNPVGKEEAEKAAEMEWLKALAGALPCGECRAFYRGYLEANPPDFGEYFKWMVDFHNAVNRKLGKPEMSREEAESRWA